MVAHKVQWGEPGPEDQPGRLDQRARPDRWGNLVIQDSQECLGNQGLRDRKAEQDPPDQTVLPDNLAPQDLEASRGRVAP